MSFKHSTRTIHLCHLPLMQTRKWLLARKEPEPQFFWCAMPQCLLQRGVYLTAHRKSCSETAMQFSHGSDLHHILTIPRSDARLNYTSMSKRCRKHVRSDHRAQARHLPTDRSLTTREGRGEENYPEGQEAAFTQP